MFTFLLFRPLKVETPQTYELIQIIKRYLTHKSEKKSQTGFNVNFKKF